MNFIWCFVKLNLNQCSFRCSGDGTLSIFNIRGKKLRARSDQMDTELLTLAVMKVSPSIYGYHIAH